MVILSLLLTPIARMELQRAFFPTSYRDIHPTPRLRPGDNRLWTSMKIFIEFRGGTTLNIPFREASKAGLLISWLHVCYPYVIQNWQWDGPVKLPKARKRDFASLSVKAGDDSTISYLIPMVTGPDGYKPLLEVHLDSVTVTSSLNDIRLLTAESCRVRMSLLKRVAPFSQLHRFKVICIRL